MFFEELEKRGLIYQKTSESLKEILEVPRVFYCGFDPTSDSLHIGSLLPLLTMRRLQNKGHRPLFLLGGATGMIGDPSGKSRERVLMDPEIIESNSRGLFKDAAKVLDFEGENPAQLINNRDWIRSYSFIEFLRDVGKHFPVNTMLARESVKNRIENRDQGISYTEFSYMLLQAFDFYHLKQTHQCDLQIGASDQWGNITAGVELIRRLQGDVQNKDSTFGFTFPLVTKPDGTKFGKTESGNIWLNPDRTSPYQFYQFFLRLSDDEALKLLPSFSLKPLEEIENIKTSFKEEPHKRLAQRELAEELTTLIHGRKEFEKALKASQALFPGDLKSLDKKTLLEVFSDTPSVTVKKDEIMKKNLAELLVSSGLCSSKTGARRDIQSGAIYVNNVRIGDGDPGNEQLPLLFDSFLILRRGKKNHCLVRFG